MSEDSLIRGHYRLVIVHTRAICLYRYTESIELRSYVEF